MKMHFTLTIESLGPLKDPFLLLRKETLFFVIIDAFSEFAVTNPAPHNSSKYAIRTLLHPWVTDVGPPQYVFQTQMYAYANNTTPLSQLELSPYQIVF